MHIPQTLQRQQRLKSRKQIDTLFKEGHSFAVYPLRIVFRTVVPEEVPLKFGVSVSTRYFKKAVDRNLLKRRIREAWRLQRAPLDGRPLHVFILYTARELLSYDRISRSMAQAIDTLKEGTS
jgi:ribonuclease P protein component